MEPSGEPYRFVGLIGFGGLTLGFARGNVFEDGRVNGVDIAAGNRGEVITFSVTMPRMKSSALAMCSRHSAMDQRSGAGLKFH